MVVGLGGVNRIAFLTSHKPSFWRHRLLVLCISFHDFPPTPWFSIYIQSWIDLTQASLSEEKHAIVQHSRHLLIGNRSGLIVFLHEVIFYCLQTQTPCPEKKKHLGISGIILFNLCQSERRWLVSLSQRRTMLTGEVVVMYGGVTIIWCRVDKQMQAWPWCMLFPYALCMLYNWIFSCFL